MNDTQTQTLAWDEVNVDESITEADQQQSENISIETPVGKFLCTVIACEAVENVMKEYTCIAAKLKLRIDDVIEIEQQVRDVKGNLIKINGEPLLKRLPVPADKKIGINALYAGRFIFDQVNLAHPKEKDAMKTRRLFVAKKIGIISQHTNRLTGSHWADSQGYQVVVTTEWNVWKDKNTDELKKNVRVGWAGYDFAASLNSSASDDDFSDI
ncbi:MAG: hypothetical protein AB7U45_10335 [Desulfamplus sp.]